MDNNNNEDKAKRISLAAEELIKATYKQTEASGIVVQREVAKNIAALQKESVDLKIDMNNKLNSVNENLQELQKQNQQSTASMLQAITTLNETINTLTVTIKEEGKKNCVQAYLHLASDSTRKIGNTICPKFGYNEQLILRKFSKGEDYTFTNYDIFEDEDNRIEICSYFSLLTGTITTFKNDGDRVWVLSQNSKADKESVSGADAVVVDATAITDVLKIDEMNGEIIDGNTCC